MDDPLEGIMQLEHEAQVAVIVSVLKTTRNTMARVEKKLDWVYRTLLGAIITVICAVVVYLVTSNHAGHTTPASTLKSAAVGIIQWLGGS